MIDVRYSTKFKKDIKTCIKRNNDMQLLQIVIDTLCIPTQLPIRNRDHNLTGIYNRYRECHIAPDWLLIYRVDRIRACLEGEITFQEAVNEIIRKHTKRAMG